jgi:hypothetical protein
MKRERLDMKNGLRRRFYPETIVGIMTAVLAVVTLVQRDWLEKVFAIDPDAGNGSVEWLIVGGLAVVTVALFSFATYEWRRASTATA